MRTFSIINIHKSNIVDLYKQGLSIRSIGDKLKISKSTVGDYIRALGISRTDFNGDKNPFYGKSHSLEVLAKISATNTGRIPVTKGISKYAHSRYVNGLLINKWKLEAKKREIEWNISNDEIDVMWEKQEGMCALTGRPMKGGFIGNKYHRCSLDRIDYKRDYTVDNCQLILGVVNLAKHVLNNIDFIQLCKDVVKYSDKQ